MGATLRALIEAFHSNPGNSNNAAAIAFALGEREEFEEALEWIERAIELDAGIVDYHDFRGRTLTALKRIEEAIASFRQSMTIAPARYIEREALADVYVTHLKDFEQAERLYYEALRLAPGRYQSYLRLANCLTQHLSYREALARMKERIGPLNNLRTCLEVLSRSLYAFGRYEEAQECCHDLLGMVKGNPTALNMLALTHAELHDLPAAARWHAQALKTNPDNFNVYQLYLTYLVRIGDLAQAQRVFRELNRRLPVLSPSFNTKPKWDGSSLRNKTVLLESKVANGFGDEINFIRFVPSLKDMGGKVILRTRKPLSSLMRTVVGIDFVTERFCESPSYDYEFDPLYLMLILDVTMDSFGRDIPYMHPSPQLSQEWRHKIDSYTGGCKIGVIWKTNNLLPFNLYTDKNIPLPLLASLSGVPGVTCFSLQMEGSSDLACLTTSHPIIDLARDFNDFMDTAAVISALDLIATADTSVAHLAGALGKPTLLMLPYSPCWRWMLGREDSPWYPTMQLIRQPRPGDWESVVNRVVRKVREVTAAGNGHQTAKK